MACRPRRSIKVITPPFLEPLTLDEVKLWVKVDGEDDDPLLVELIPAAREHAESFLSRALMSQTIRLTLDLAGGRYLDDLPEGVYDLPVTFAYGGLDRSFDLPMQPVQSITSISTYDTNNAATVYESENYTLNVDGSRLLLNSDAYWPSNLRPAGACEITYVAGYGDDASTVPRAIRTGMLMHVQRMYDERIICDLPDGCIKLYQPYRVMGEY